MHQQIQNRKHLTPMLNSSFRILEQEQDSKKKKEEKDNSKEQQDDQDNKKNDQQDDQDPESSDDEDQDLEKINEEVFEPLFREHTNQKSLKKIIKDLHTDLKEVKTKYVKNEVQEADMKENFKNSLLNQHHELYFKCEAHGGNFKKFIDFQLICKDHEKASIKIMHANKVERTIVVNIANFFSSKNSDQDQLLDVYDFKHQFSSNMSFPNFFVETPIYKLKIFAIFVISAHFLLNQLQCYQIGIYLRKNVKEFQFQILVKIIYLIDKIQAKFNQIMNKTAKQISQYKKQMHKPNHYRIYSSNYGSYWNSTCYSSRKLRFNIYQLSIILYFDILFILLSLGFQEYVKKNYTNHSILLEWVITWFNSFEQFLKKSGNILNGNFDIQKF